MFSVYIKSHSWELGYRIWASTGLHAQFFVDMLFCLSKPSLESSPPSNITCEVAWTLSCIEPWRQLSSYFNPSSFELEHFPFIDAFPGFGFLPQGVPILSLFYSCCCRTLFQVPILSGYYIKKGFRSDNNETKRKVSVIVHIDWEFDSLEASLEYTCEELSEYISQCGKIHPKCGS